MNALWGAASSAYSAVSSLFQGCVYPPENEEEQALDAAPQPAPLAAAPVVAQQVEPEPDAALLEQPPGVNLGAHSIAVLVRQGESPDGYGPGWNPQEQEIVAHSYLKSPVRRRKKNGAEASPPPQHPS